MSKRTVAIRILLDTAENEADNELRRCLMAGHGRIYSEIAGIGRALIVLLGPLVARLERLWRH